MNEWNCDNILIRYDQKRREFYSEDLYHDPIIEEQFLQIEKFIF